MRKIIRKALDSYRERARLNSLKANMDFMDNRAGETAKEFNAFPLSNEEKVTIDSFWSQYVERTPGYQFYELNKMITGFDVKQIPESIFYMFMLPKLNDHDEALILQDKNIYGFYFNDENRPLEIVRNVRGIFYDANNTCINQETAIEDVLNYKGRLIVKPTCDTEQGHDVKLIVDYTKPQIESLFASYKENFVFQEAIEQCDEIAAFNPTSLNTIRIVSLFLNGKYSVLASALRCGDKGSIVDNAGSGGMMVGIHPDGTLYDFGVNKHGKIFTEAHTGVKLKGYKLHDFDKVLAFTERLHKQLPFLPFIGWDIAVRKDGTPTFIELGASSTGIFVIQMCCGPIFGERFDEVMEYLRKKSGQSILTTKIEKKFRTC